MRLWLSLCVQAQGMGLLIFGGLPPLKAHQMQSDVFKNWNTHSEVKFKNHLKTFAPGQSYILVTS